MVEASQAKPASAVVAKAKVLERTVLTATFPGDVSIRGTQAIVVEALGESQSVGWPSELRLAAGRQVVTSAAIGVKDVENAGEVDAGFVQRMQNFGRVVDHAVAIPTPHMTMKIDNSKEENSEHSPYMQPMYITKDRAAI